MTYVSALAVYFILWWMVLFAVLPFGLKTQDDEGERVLGTVSSAPRGPHVLRAMVLTTVISLVIFAVLAVLTRYYGLSIDDIPRIAPEFD